MAAETYEFEWFGAQFRVTLDSATVATTTQSPNVRTISGTWKTWRMFIDDTVPGIAGVRILKSIGGSSSTPHANGNLTPTQSASVGHMIMSTPNGQLYKVPTGYGVVGGRIMTAAEWNTVRTQWEQEVTP